MDDKRVNAPKRCLISGCGESAPGSMQEGVCDSCKESVVDRTGACLSVGSSVLCHFTVSGVESGIVIEPLVFHKLCDEPGWVIWVQMEDADKGSTVPTTIIEAVSGPVIAMDEPQQEVDRLQAENLQLIEEMGELSAANATLREQVKGLMDGSQDDGESASRVIQE